MSPLVDVQLPKPDKKLPVVLSLAQMEELLEMPRKMEPEARARPWQASRDVAIMELFYSSGFSAVAGEP